MKTRRRFLAQTATAMLGTAILPQIVAEVPRAARRPHTLARRAGSLEDLSLDSFQRLVDTAFLVRAPDGVRSLLLVQAERQSSPETDAAVPLDTFSLIFRHGTGQLLSQSTYPFYHSRIGEFSMFIVPVDRAVGGQHYQAVFNRIPLSAAAVGRLRD